MGEAPYEVVGDIARICLTFSKGSETDTLEVTAAIQHIRDSGLGKVLIDISALHDARPPTVAERHWLMTQWAHIGRGYLQIALVLPPHMVDPDDFGYVAARSRGLMLREFTSLDDAMLWLHDERMP